MTKKRKITLIIIAIIVIVIVAGGYYSAKQGSKPVYTTAKVERGTLEQTAVTH